MHGEAPGRLWKTSRANHAYGSKKGICLGVNVSGTFFDALSGCAVRPTWFLCVEALGDVVPSLLHWPTTTIYVT